MSMRSLVAFLPLLAFACTVCGQCDPSKDFAIAYNGPSVFTIFESNGTCHCPAGYASSGASSLGNVTAANLIVTGVATVVSGPSSLQATTVTAPAGSVGLAVTGASGQFAATFAGGNGVSASSLTVSGGNVNLAGGSTILSSCTAGQFQIRRNGVDNHCYMAFWTSKVGFTQAQRNCEAIGAHLAAVTSAAENAFIVSNIVTPNSASLFTGLQGPWLGLTDMRSESNFEWVTGEVAVQDTSLLYTGFASPSTSVAGQPDNGGVQHGSMWIDGPSNSYVVTPALTSYFTATSPITVELWFKPATAGIILYEWGNLPINTGWSDSWLELGTSGQIVGRVWSIPAQTFGYISGFNQWNHVLLRYDSSTTTTTGFVNGVQGPSYVAARSSPLSNSGYGQYFGVAGPGSQIMLGSGLGLRGYYDEFRVWNVARSNAQVASSWTTNAAGNEAGLVLLYRFDVGGGSSVVDSTGHGFTGSVVGVAQWSITDGSPTFGEDCVGYYNPTNVFWADYQCSTVSSYVCERDY